VPLDCVSHGTRDQVTLLLRLALCETLSGSTEPVPLLLDEPLITADPARRQTLIQFLHNMAGTHQVVLSTADPSVADAVRSTCGDLCAVVSLPACDADAGARRRVRIAG